MITDTWADVSVSATLTGGPATPFAAQLADGGRTLVLRAVSGAAPQPLQVTLAGGAAAAGPTMTLWTLTGDPGQDNTPSAPDAIAPVNDAAVPISPGATTVSAAAAHGACTGVIV